MRHPKLENHSKNRLVHITNFIQNATKKKNTYLIYLMKKKTSTNILYLTRFAERKQFKNYHIFFTNVTNPFYAYFSNAIDLKN